MILEDKVYSVLLNKQLKYRESDGIKGRIYAPSIELQPALELEYLSSSRRKLVQYEDILQYQILNVGAGTSFNQNLANSIVKPKGIVIIPFVASTVNGLSVSGTGSLGNTSPFSPVLSPFASEPATSSPLLALNSLVLV